MAVEFEIVEKAAGLEDLYADWDQLAVESELPMAAPAWVLAWLRHVAPADIQVRTIVVRDGTSIIGIVPFVAQTTGGAVVYELMANRLGRTAPLARAGRDWDVAEASWRALSAIRPSPQIVRFANAPLRSWYGAWHTTLHNHVGRWLPPIRRRSAFQVCPVVTLTGTFETWFQRKSPNFRSEMRRLRRKLAAAGASIRESTPATLECDLDTYMRLHLQRWRDRESALQPIAGPLAVAFAEMAHAMPEGRVRLYTIELDGAPIASQLFLAAGGEVIYHNGGWDERYGHLKPGIVGLLHAVEQAFARADTRMDLGPGIFPYKMRFADGGDPVVCDGWLLPGARMPLIVAQRTGGMLASSVLRIAVGRTHSATPVEPPAHPQQRRERKRLEA